MSATSPCLLDRIDRAIADLERTIDDLRRLRGLADLFGRPGQPHVEELLGAIATGESLFTLTAKPPKLRFERPPLDHRPAPTEILRRELARRPAMWVTTDKAVHLARAAGWEHAGLSRPKDQIRSALNRMHMRGELERRKVQGRTQWRMASVETTDDPVSGTPAAAVLAALRAARPNAWMSTSAIAERAATTCQLFSTGSERQRAQTRKILLSLLDKQRVELKGRSKWRLRRPA